MPTGIYTRRKGLHGHGAAASALRAQLLHTGLTARLDQLLTELRTLTDAFPEVLDLVPGLEPVLNTSLPPIAATLPSYVTRNGASRHDLPLRPPMTEAARARTARKMLGELAARQEARTTGSEIKPKTNTPCRLSAAVRRKMSRVAKRRAKTPAGRKAWLANLQRAHEAKERLFKARTKGKGKRKVTKAGALRRETANAIK